MKRFLLAILVFGSISAFARDSIWLLCDNGALALNMLEHRSGAASRATHYTLIYGAHILSADISEKNYNRISLSSKNDKFNGAVTFDSEGAVARVKGRLVLDGESFDIDSKLTCKEMNGDL